MISIVLDLNEIYFWKTNELAYFWQMSVDLRRNVFSLEKSTECVVIHFFANHSGKRVNLGTDNGFRFDRCLDSNKRRLKEVDLGFIVQQINSFTM